MNNDKIFCFFCDNFLKREKAVKHFKKFHHINVKEGTEGLFIMPWNEPVKNIENISLSRYKYIVYEKYKNSHNAFLCDNFYSYLIHEQRLINSIKDDDFNYSIIKTDKSDNELSALMKELSIETFDS